MQWCLSGNFQFPRAFVYFFFFEHRKQYSHSSLTLKNSDKNYPEELFVSPYNTIFANLTIGHPDQLEKQLEPR